MRIGDARATWSIAVVTSVVSVLITISGLLPWAALAGGFIPVRLEGAVLPAEIGHAVPVWLTPLSATLVHGGFAHLALNLLMLVFCGAQAERALGGRGVLMLYGVGAFAAAAGQWLVEPGSAMPMVGASGAISALVGAYALLYGRRRARPVGPFPADLVHVAWLFAGWVGVQLLVGFAQSSGSPIAIGAHIGGFLVGLALARPLLRWQYRHA